MKKKSSCDMFSVEVYMSDANEQVDLCVNIQKSEKKPEKTPVVPQQEESLAERYKRWLDNIDR
jgi:hypothetical protein